MRIRSILAPVTIAAALALTACAPAAQTVTPAPSYTPATITALLAPVAPPAAIAKLATPAAVATPPATDTITAPPARCEEDQPCWICSEMGNKICGSDTPAQVQAQAPAAAYVPASRPAVKAQAPAPVARPVAPVVVAPAPAAATPAPKSCSALALGDGGTTAQHNCIPAATDIAVGPNTPLPAAIPCTTASPCFGKGAAIPAVTRPLTCAPDHSWCY